jgi:methyl-accepting chemotaxis protein
MIASVSKAMNEQAAASEQGASAVNDMRRQAEQVARAMNEQGRAAKDINTATQNTSKQIAVVVRANREHSAAAGTILNSLADIRKITERNAQGVKETHRSSADLLERTKNLIAIMDRLQK